MRRPVTLRNGLIMIVVVALVPIGTLSVVQALSNLNYSRELIGSGLVTGAFAKAARERDPFTISKQVLLRLSKERSVVAADGECRGALLVELGNSRALINLARSNDIGRVQCSILPVDPSSSFAAEQ